MISFPPSSYYTNWSHWQISPSWELLPFQIRSSKSDSYSSEYEINYLIVYESQHRWSKQRKHTKYRKQVQTVQSVKLFKQINCQQDAISPNNESTPSTSNDLEEAERQLEQFKRTNDEIMCIKTKLWKETKQSYHRLTQLTRIQNPYSLNHS